MVRPLRSLLLGASTLVTLGVVAPLANPLDPTIAAGSAGITGESTANLTVHQSTDKAIINWNSFNIGFGETTTFVQPGAGSVTLNRVTGGLGSSTIDGALKANGNIFLINPDGILLGAGSSVDANGFVATTADIADDDFLAGRYFFGTAGNVAASIVNRGTITVEDAGFAALVAPGVRNDGTITARLGSIGLASANGFTLDFYGDRLITLAVDDEIAGEVKDVATGLPLDALVKNAGALKADGGTVQLTAAAARKVVDAVVNNTGVIEANSIGVKNGRIVLGAATASTKSAGLPKQTVKVSGKLSAAGKKEGEAGGRIVVTGEDIVLAAAALDASGWAGGGAVLIGGDVGGGNPVAAVAGIAKTALEAEAVETATATSIDAATVIDASATEAGDGGKVVVWADGNTRLDGTIAATGGRENGDGGFIETSGGAMLEIAGLADASATFGLAGTWLLDPSELVIENAAPYENSLRNGTNVSLSASVSLILADSIAKGLGSDGRPHDASFNLTAPFIYQMEGVSIESTEGRLNVDYEATDRVWFGRGFAGGTSSIMTNGGNVTLHGVRFVGVNGVIDAGFGQVLIKAENPIDEIDRGILLTFDTFVAGSRIDINSPIRAQDPGVRLEIRKLGADIFGNGQTGYFNWPDDLIAGSTPQTIEPKDPFPVDGPNQPDPRIFVVIAQSAEPPKVGLRPGDIKGELHLLINGKEVSIASLSNGIGQDGSTSAPNQCTDLIVRYATKLGLNRIGSTRDTGHGKDTAKNFAAKSNGSFVFVDGPSSVTLPSKGAVLSIDNQTLDGEPWRGNDYGHVGIVQDVSVNGDTATVTLFDQNFPTESGKWKVIIFERIGGAWVGTMSNTTKNPETGVLETQKLAVSGWANPKPAVSAGLETAGR